jgi:hypothetical protein
MTFQYETEYRLGRKGRVRRTYCGVQALIAIAFDLVLGFTFGLIGLGLWMVRCGVTTAYRITIALICLPLRIARAVSVACSSRVAAKPAWASYDEL